MKNSMLTAAVLSITLIAGFQPSAEAVTLDKLCESDCKNEFAFFRKYAKQGSTLAKFSLAVMYYQGHGTEKNIKAANRWIKEAAKEGEPGAQYQLGYFYKHGLFFEKNLEKARIWYSLAARRNTLDSRKQLRLVEQEIERGNDQFNDLRPAAPTEVKAAKVKKATAKQGNMERITVVFNASYAQLLEAAKVQTCNQSCEPFWKMVLAPLIKVKEEGEESL